MKKFIRLFVVSLFLLAGCGKESGTHIPNPTPQPVEPTGKKVTLLLFGAPWCSACKTKLPEVQSLLSQLSTAQRDLISVQLYVTTSEQPTQPPTQDIAEKYRDFLHLQATASADLPWRWTHFRKYIPGKLELPAAAVLNEGMETLKAYKAGDTSFVPQEIVSFVVDKTK